MLRLLRVLLLPLALAPAGPLLAAEPVATPYGEVSLPMELHQVPDAPVYYLVGLSGVPGAENEGHTSNAGFVVTDAGVVVFDALGTPALGYRMLQRIREVTDQPIERIIVSHYHADHIYGLQAFEEHAGDPPVWAQQLALGYVGGSTDSQGEDAERRLAQRREALFPWVDEDTYVVAPDRTFEQRQSFDMGNTRIELLHAGPAHAPDDTIMVVHGHRIVFSGDLIFGGRLPFLGGEEVNTKNWLAGLEYLQSLEPAPAFVIPGHGRPDADPAESIAFTRGYLEFLRREMGRAVENLTGFDTAYARTDWSSYRDVPTFDAANRGNAYQVFMEMEGELFE